MTLAELVTLFIDSRKRGICGARRKSSPATVATYTQNLKDFSTFIATEFGTVSYKDIKRTQLAAYLDTLDKRQASGKWSKATALVILRTLKAFFRWIDKDDDCREAGISGMQKYLPVIDKTPSRAHIPQVKDLKAFKTTFNTKNIWGHRNYVATCLMASTGIRVGEVCNLRLDHTKLDESLVIVTGKTGPRPIPLTDEMTVLLRSWLKRRSKTVRATTSPYVFVSRRADKINPNGIGQAFRRHRDKMGLGKITSHSMRHVFSTRYLQKGGDMERLRLLTGHTSYAMLQNYLHLAKVGSDTSKKELEKVNLLSEL